MNIKLDKNQQKLVRIALAISIWLFAITIKANAWLFLVVLLISGYDVMLKAFRSILEKQVSNEKFLMSIATIGAFMISEYSEAIAVMVFYQIGEYFQSRAIAKSRKFIKALLDLKPKQVNLIQDDKVNQVLPSAVNISDIILIKPGEQVPLDVVIIEGSSSVNTAALTGEAVYKDVTINDELLSGYININGLLKARVIKDESESTITKILALVEHATSRKATTETFITRFARYYTPIVVMIAVLLTLIPFVMGLDLSTWFYRSLLFLVVSCPCALVIAVPLSYFGGIGKASKNGILIKGSNYLEALAQAKIFVFDKTGTLTDGKFEVEKINTSYDSEELLMLVAHAEHHLSHPIATAIKQAYNKKIDKSLIKSVKELPGLGVIAQIADHKVVVGNQRLMQEIVSFPISHVEAAMQTVYVALDDKYVGTITLNDQIKTDVIPVLANLRKKGIDEMIMLTGDRAIEAKAIAQKLKLDQVISELLPSDKVNEVEKLLRQKPKNSKLVFVGDGINDAPSLALADVGIAMGFNGSEAAIEAADIVLMHDDFKQLTKARTIAKSTQKIVYQNILMTIGVKMIILILGALGLTNMWAAIFADVGVTLIAIINALRLLL
ncbi:MAG: heavy metal translocating P-type ATPase [Erysipelotrichaceae bacterium]|nr:heavy metal translocating P-type ATPase [Erysipelotrichaceae bacterium]